MHKRSYVMRISDWSSYVCSSDLFHQMQYILVVPHLGVGAIAEPVIERIVAGRRGQKQRREIQRRRLRRDMAAQARGDPGAACFGRDIDIAQDRKSVL